ncbi:hypothetical protein AAMO2058_000565100 [Amorphochlora amoebiformis]
METGTGVRGPQALRLTSVVAAVLLGGVFLWGIVFGEGSEKERRDGEQVSDEADDEYLGKPKTVAEFRPPQGGHVVGLQNNGNTCFLNCILQALSSVRSYLHFLHHLRAQAPNLELAKELQTVSLGLTGDAIEVHRILAQKERMYRGNAQQDAHELFTSLISAIESDLKRLRRRMSRFPEAQIKPNSNKNKNHMKEERRDPTRSLLIPFTGATASTKLCLVCGYTPAVTHEAFWTLGLPLVLDKDPEAEMHMEENKTKTVEELVLSYSREQSLPDVICERCSAEECLATVKKAKMRQSDPKSRWSHPRARAFLSQREHELERFLESGIDEESKGLSAIEKKTPPDLPWASKPVPSSRRLSRMAKCNIVRRDLLIKLPSALCLHLQRRFGSVKISDFVQVIPLC